MDFQIPKKDLNAALRQILQGRKPNSTDVVDMTVDGNTLTVTITGSNLSVEVVARERGSFSIPVGVLFKIKQATGTYEGETLRIRIEEGKFRLQGMSVSHPEIKPRKIARRIIDIPDDALPRDILSLPLILSLDEIEDCGLHKKLLEAQKKMADDIESATATLAAYGFERNELAAMAKAKIKVHADALKPILFAQD
jgi:hypothetical protein